MRKLRSKPWLQHKAQGDELKILDRRVAEISLDLQSVYGVGSIAGRSAKTASKHLTNLRLAMDVVVGRDCPDVSVEVLNKCYRG